MYLDNLIEGSFIIIWCIYDFLFLIKTQFGKTIKVLRSDNAKEYFSTQFNSFLISHGITHQSSCPHTPQQNGVAERKHRHIVDIARTLLINADASLELKV